MASERELFSDNEADQSPMVGFRDQDRHTTVEAGAALFSDDEGDAVTAGDGASPQGGPQRPSGAVEPMEKYTTNRCSGLSGSSKQSSTVSSVLGSLMNGLASFIFLHADRKSTEARSAGADKADQSLQDKYKQHADDGSVDSKVVVFSNEDGEYY